MTTVNWYRKRYRYSMAMNLRLPDQLAEALRALAAETGRSQQDLVREALEEYVRDYRLRGFPPEVRPMLTLPDSARSGVSAGLRDVLATHDLSDLLANLDWVHQERMS